MIFAIMGHTGSGKTTLANELNEKFDIPVITTHTDRPMRDGEVDGIDYHFKEIGKITPDKYVCIREFWTVYRDEPFVYGLLKEDIEKFKHCIIVVDPRGYKSLVDMFPLVSGFVLDVPKETLKERLIARGDDINEFYRRYESDSKDFEELDNLDKMQFSYYKIKTAIGLFLLIEDMRAKGFLKGQSTNITGDIYGG